MIPNAMISQRMIPPKMLTVGGGRHRAGYNCIFVGESKSDITNEETKKRQRGEKVEIKKERRKVEGEKERERKKAKCPIYTSSTKNKKQWAMKTKSTHT
jgi:hypothetical protein